MNNLKDYIGKELYIPDAVNSLSKSGSNLKIVSYIDGNCSMCIDDLIEWKEYIIEMKEYKNLDYIFFTNALDFYGFTDYIKTEIKFPLPVFFDDENSFFIKNNLNPDKTLQTFLINDNNKVILVGNPRYSERLRALYKKEIKKRN